MVGSGSSTSFAYPSDHPSLPNTLRMYFCLPNEDQAFASSLRAVGFTIIGESGEGRVISGPFSEFSDVFDGRIVTKEFRVDSVCANISVSTYIQRLGENALTESGSVTFRNAGPEQEINLDFRLPLAEYIILPARGPVQI